MQEHSTVFHRPVLMYAHRNAIAWIQQSNYIPRLAAWFKLHGVPANDLWKLLKADPSHDTTIVQQLINNTDHTVIEIPWQMIPLLDNLGDRSVYKLNHSDLVRDHIVQQDKLQQRHRGYTLDQLVEKLLSNTIDPPTLLLETVDPRLKPQMPVIDGRTRLALAWAHKHNIPARLYQF